MTEICNNDAWISEYTDLFSTWNTTVEDVEADFNDAFGESFQFIDPVSA